MNLNIIKNEKNEIEVECDNLTIIELLREYLNNDSGVEFVAWKREHPTKNPILKVKTKGKTPKKAINDTISIISKELDKLDSDFKKIK
ncbi:MAG: RpoL/Rpb11 RNA polymerase subunit family protein [Nanoarchaeota archaeon]